MTNQLVSIIVPVYNVEKYIRECIESILNQSYDKIQVIIVDDCGHDNSMPIVDEIVSSYNGRKSINIVHRNDNGGISAARNSGIAVAEGNLIYFIDSDDFLGDLCAIEKMVQRQEMTGADVVTANSIMFDDISGRIYKTVDRDLDDNFFKNNGDEFNISIGGVAWNRLIKADFIRQNDLYFDEGIVFEDEAWIFKLICSSPSIVTMSDHIYRYRYRVGSIMNSISPNHLMSRIILPIACSSWLIQHGTKKKAYAANKIEDLKFGCYNALYATNNIAYLNYVIKLYKSLIQIPHIRARSVKVIVKLIISLLPDSIYSQIIKYWIANKTNNKINKNVLKIDQTFLNELNDKINIIYTKNFQNS